MARARNIKPSFFTDDELAEQPPLARLLFQALWCIADREGRLEDRPKRIQAVALPYDKCNVDTLLGSLHEARFIIRYEVDGRKFIQIRQFLKHQDPHYKEKPSEIPPPPGWPEQGSNSGPSTPQSSTDDRSINAQSSADDKPTIPDMTRGQSPLIPDSGFLIPDSFNRIPDSGSPPPDPGLPHPAARSPRRLQAPPNGGTARSKPVEKDRRSTPNGNGAQLVAEAAIHALGKQRGILPKSSETFSEYQARVLGATEQPTTQ